MPSCVALERAQIQLLGWLSTQVSAAASAAADFELREPRVSVTFSDLELLLADR